MIDLTAPVQTKTGMIGVAMGRTYLPGGLVYDVQFPDHYERWHESLLQQIGAPRPDLIKLKTESQEKKK